MYLFIDEGKFTSTQNCGRKTCPAPPYFNIIITPALLMAFYSFFSKVTHINKGNNHN